ncbi:24225_t:CDS:2 [Gigaspora margarita]|uniref:24225_t:CDS:1 n=1 Tax=Gigaspora margarita TaxID=4874 RepID=A0ABN7WDS4_GIGMA|nr:24225_t:CDS:2 [Gigaspora margarita]
MKLDNIKNLYTKAQEEVEQVHDEQKILTLKIDRHIAKYIGISDPNFIAIIRHSIDLYKWIQQKNSHKELLTVEEKILIEEKLEDGKISSVEDSIKGDHFLLNKKRNIDNVDDSSTKKKIDSRIRVAEMTLNKSELEVLSGKNLEEAKNKAALLYAEYKTDKSKEPLLEETLVLKANLNIEDKDKMVVDSGYNNIKDIIQNAIIKAANQTLPKKKILNTGCSRKRSKVKTELEKSILVLGKIIRSICNGKVSQLNSNIVVSANNNILYINKKLVLEIGLLQPQSLNEGEQDLRGWKKILKKILEKQDHSRELITKPEEVMSITEKHFQNQYQKKNTRPNLLTQKWAEIYKPASYVQESLYENL